MRSSLSGVSSLANNVQGLGSKKVLLRVDLNLPTMQDGSLADISRINAIVPTLRYLAQHNVKVILISHMEGKDEAAPPSFCCIFEKLREVIQQHVPGNVVLVDIAESSDEELRRTIDDSRNQVILLENLRRHPGERANDKDFAKRLSSLADIYVNDAFSCSHREHASIIGIPEFLPSYAGIHFWNEIEFLEKTMFYGRQSLSGLSKGLFIVGGKKVSTKLPTIRGVAENCGMSVAVVGAVANTVLQAAGFFIGSSFHEPSYASEARMLFNHDMSIYIPEDVLTNDGEEVRYRELLSEKLNSREVILDIGIKSLNRIDRMIQDASTIIWNGPAGYFEDPRFNVGTFFLVQALIRAKKHGAITIVGGGDTIAALSAYGVSLESGVNFTHVSTGGGAFLVWLQNRDLPGLDALRKRPCTK